MKIDDYEDEPVSFTDFTDGVVAMACVLAVLVLLLIT